MTGDVTSGEGQFAERSTTRFAAITCLLEDAHEVAVSGQAAQLKAIEYQNLAEMIATRMQSIMRQCDEIMSGASRL
jgi:hypothetical protein